MEQIISDVLDTKIVTLNIEEGPAYGAALLAGVGAGIYSNVEEACRRTVKEISETNPIRENLKKYRKIYEIYRSLYEDLKDDYKKLCTL